MMNKFNLAFFGQNGAGKTALLASYYSHLMSSRSEMLNGYALMAASTAQNNLLIEMHHKLQNGHFPETTSEHQIYPFEARVDNQAQLLIEWLDYPGAWWKTDPEDAADAQKRKNVMQTLLNNHLAFLLVDGKRWVDEGPGYLSALFSSFAQEIKRHKQGLERSADYPDQWIIALTKADLFGSSYSAEEFAKQISQQAQSALDELKKAIGSRSFGQQYLLLSAAASTDGKVANASRTIGLELIAPLVIPNTLDKLLKNIPGQIEQVDQSRTWWQTLGEKAAIILEKVADIPLPEKFRTFGNVLISTLKNIGLIEWMKKPAQEIRQEQERLKMQGKLYESLLAGFTVSLKEAQSTGVYYKQGA